MKSRRNASAVVSLERSGSANAMQQCKIKCVLTLVQRLCIDAGLLLKNRQEELKIENIGGECNE